MRSRPPSSSKLIDNTVFGEDCDLPGTEPDGGCFKCYSSQSLIYEYNNSRQPTLVGRYNEITSEIFADVGAKAGFPVMPDPFIVMDKSRAIEVEDIDDRDLGFDLGRLRRGSLLPDS